MGRAQGVVWQGGAGCLEVITSLSLLITENEVEARVELSIKLDP